MSEPDPESDGHGPPLEGGQVSDVRFLRFTNPKETVYVVRLFRIADGLS